MSHDCVVDGVEVIKDPNTGENIGLLPNDITTTEKINNENIIALLCDMKELLEKIELHLSFITNEEL